MTTIMQYLQRVLIVAIPAVLVFLCFNPYRMKALAAMNLRTSRRREVGLVLFVIAIFGIRYSCSDTVADIYFDGLSRCLGRSSYFD